MGTMMRSMVTSLCICGCFFNPTDANTVDAMDASSTGIGSSTGGGPQKPATELAGIYELLSWTHNPEGCDVEGSSVLDKNTENYFYIKPEVDESEAFLSVPLCKTLADCRAAAASHEIDYSYVLPEGSDGDGWSGHETVAFDMPCEARTSAYFLIGSGFLRVRFEARQLAAVAVMCDEDGGEVDAAARDQPCEQLEVREGYLVEPL